VRPGCQEWESTSTLTCVAISVSPPFIKRCLASLAALLAGVPQVLVPLHFDQFGHAERAADLGLAPPPLPGPLLVGELAAPGDGSMRITTEEPLDYTDVPASKRLRRDEPEEQQPTEPDEHVQDTAAAVQAVIQALRQALGSDMLAACRSFAQVGFPVTAAVRTCCFGPIASPLKHTSMMCYGFQPLMIINHRSWHVKTAWLRAWQFCSSCCHTIPELCLD
jgi:hypothetical protein